MVLHIYFWIFRKKLGAATRRKIILGFFPCLLGLHVGLNIASLSIEAVALRL